MSSICGLCCTYYGIPEMQNLFDNKNQFLLDELNYCACFTFRIDVNSGFSPYICKRCTKLLHAAYEFKMICESAETNFRAISNDTDKMQVEDKYEIEYVEYEQDGTLKDLEMDVYYNATETTPENGNTELCIDDSNEKKTNKFGAIIHTNVNGPSLSQSTIPLHLEKRKVCTKAIGSTCDICGETFRRKRELERHFRIAHRAKKNKIEREKSWICESCGKHFCSQYALRHHINGTHVDIVEKNYACDLCDFKCRLARYLVSHMYTHNGIKRYRCKECGMAFSAHCSMNRHIQAVHKKLRPHKCNICDRYFKTRVRLNEHSYFHSGVRHECLHCPKTYRYKNSLIRHMKQSHKGVTKSLTVGSSSISGK